jgi:hypothetical protein
MNERNDRRGFLGSLFAVAAGAMASSMLVGCAAEDDETSGPAEGPVEHVALRSGLRPFNRVPRTVASVRTYDFAMPRVNEHVSSKADRI